MYISVWDLLVSGNGVWVVLRKHNAVISLYREATPALSPLRVTVSERRGPGDMMTIEKLDNIGANVAIVSGLLLVANGLICMLY